LLLKIQEVKGKASKNSVDIRNTRLTRADTIELDVPTVFGAYCSQSVKDESEFFGDESCFIFSLLPTCKVFKTINANEFKNFVYFNSGMNPDSPNTIRRVGLGFGGKSSERCRIWIDKDMAKNSYVSEDQDETYLNGALIAEESPYGVSNISPLAIEVYTFGSTEKQQMFNNLVKR